MGKKEEKETEKTEEVSIDWFEDHEFCEEEDKEKIEEIKDEELEDFFEETDNFSQRLGHFLANQKKDVSLEKILDLPKNTLEENFQSRPRESNVENEKIEYIPKTEEENQAIYKPISVETHFSKPEISSAEKILEEQKALYKHIDLSGEMTGKRKSDWNPVTPEETSKKDYLLKRKI